MSLRDFNNTHFPDDPTALHHGAAGNEAGLESFHTLQPEDVEPNNTPKIVGAIAVALMVGVAGAALYASQSSSPMQSKQMIAAAPAPVSDAVTPASAPASAPVAALEPASQSQPAAIEPVAPAPVKSMPVKSASSAKTAPSPNLASSSVQPQQQAAITPPATVTPELPVGPSPSPSDVATNNVQSGVAVPQGATTASDIPSPAPAEGANPVPAPTPEPAQPSAQPSGQTAQ